MHARYSPSRLGGLAKCPKFEYKKTTDGSDEEGTMLHAACQYADYRGLNEEQRQ
jgi:hypothetical protein